MCSPVLCTYIVHAANLWSINQRTCRPLGWSGTGILARICPLQWCSVISAVCLHFADHQLPVDNRQQSSFGPPLDHSASVPHPTEPTAFLPRMVDSSSNPFQVSNTSQSKEFRPSSSGRGCRYHAAGLGLCAGLRIAAVSTDFSIRCTAIIWRGRSVRSMIRTACSGFRT